MADASRTSQRCFHGGFGGGSKLGWSPASTRTRPTLSGKGVVGSSVGRGPRSRGIGIKIGGEKGKMSRRRSRYSRTSARPRRGQDSL